MVILVLNLEKSLGLCCHVNVPPPALLVFRVLKEKADLGRFSNDLKRVCASRDKALKAALHLEKCLSVKFCF